MNYKKIALVFLVLLLAVSMVSARETVLSKANELRIDLLRYDPSPIEPGKPSDIWFEITNLGDEDINNFEIILAGGSTGLLKSGVETLNFGRLKAGEKITFAFTITPNSEIIDGDYNLNLEYFSAKLDQLTSEPFTIKVKRVNRDVSATSTKITTTEIDTGMLIQGETSKLTLTVYNSADHIMKDITVSLDLSSSDIPISPIGTTSEAKIKAINPRQGVDLIFNLIALPDATSGVYKVPLTIKYYDEIGNNYTKTDLIGLIVDGVPELHVELKGNEIYSFCGIEELIFDTSNELLSKIKFLPIEVGSTDCGTGEVTVNIINKGLSKLKFLTVQLEPTTEKSTVLWKKYDKYQILSEDQIYLGEIDSDDDESVDFLLKVRASDRKITMPITLDYKDANNKQHTETFELEVDIHSKKTLGLEKSSYAMKLIFMALVIFFFLNYRKWKKQSNKKGIMLYLKHLKDKLSRKK
ncbi:MAG: hypothetical protein V1914_03645 [archaeon]